MGDDYCRYRPYVVRDHQNKLIGVTYNNNFEYIKKRSLNYFRIGENTNSGFEYFLNGL